MRITIKLFLYSLLAFVILGPLPGLSLDDTPGPDPAFQQLKTRLSSNNLNDRVTALKKLGQLNSLPAVRLMLTVADDNRPEIKTSLVNALAQTDDPATIQWLVEKGLFFPDEQIRTAIARSLNQTSLKTINIQSALIQALADPAWPVRQAATQALGRFDDPKIIAALKKSLLDKRSWQVRETAIKILAQYNRPAAVKILFEGHHEHDLTLQWFLEETLTDRKGLGANKEALDYIARKELSSTHPFARSIAARVLGRQISFFVSTDQLAPETLNNYINLLLKSLEDKFAPISIDKIGTLAEIVRTEKLPDPIRRKIIGGLIKAFEIFDLARIRLAAAIALLNAYRHDYPRGVIKVLDEEFDWRVRGALKLVLIEHLHSLPPRLRKDQLDFLIKQLSEVMTSEEDLAEVLTEFTGQNFGENHQDWSSWLARQDKISPTEPKNNLPALLAHRVGRAKSKALKKNGGDAATEATVRKGLIWLLRNQEIDGRWNCLKHTPYFGWSPLPIFTNESELVDASVTGLALLSFLGTGATHQSGAYREVIRNGLEYLINCQDAQGLINFEKEHKHTPRCLPHGPDHGVLPRRYNHNIGMLTLVEAYALTKDPWLKPVAQKALDHAKNFRDPAYGWSFYLEPTDIATSVFYITALLVAREGTDLKVNQAEIKQARHYLTRLTHDVSGRIHHLSGPPYCFGGYDSMATAMFCRLLLKRLTLERMKNTDQIQKNSADHLTKHPPVWESHYQAPVPPDEAALMGRQVGLVDLLSVEDDILNQWYWYYATLAFLNFESSPPKDGSASGTNAQPNNYWTKWNPQMKNILLQHQRRGGLQDGSWDPVGVWATVGGRVYSTAFAIMTLEAYYSYDLQKEPNK